MRKSRKLIRKIQGKLRIKVVSKKEFYVLESKGDDSHR